MTVREAGPSVESVYRYASVSQLGALLRSGELTPAQLHECALRVLQRYGTPLNAIANLLPERGSRDAAWAESRLQDAASSPLCGIPYAAKDLFAATGGPTTWGGRAFLDQHFDADAVVVDRLRAAGAVLSAKATMIEFAGGGRPDVAGASVHGSGRNPWDPRHYAGGSSMGSAIVVAAGLVPYALGTETGGSVVGPAAFCGVTGIRPTYGLVPRTGVMPLSDTLDKVGILARSADDISEVLSVIAGPDGTDRASAGSFMPRAALNREECGGIRVGIAAADSEDWQPNAASQLATAMEQFQDLGVTFMPVQLPRDDATSEALQTIMLCEAGANFRQYLERPDFTSSDAGQLSRLRASLTRPAVDYIDALQVQRRTAAAIAEIFTEVDVLLGCSRPSPAPRLDEQRSDVGRTHADWVRGMANLVGLPGISFPCGLSTDRLPLGLHLVGPHHTEPLLLALVGAFQQATDHHLLRPPV